MNRERLTNRIDAAIKILEDAKQHITDSDMPCMTANHYINQAISALFDEHNVSQEQQICDHTLVEKTKFGDLKRSFECIFCDHKTTEVRVTQAVDSAGKAFAGVEDAFIFLKRGE